MSIPRRFIPAAAVALAFSSAAAMLPAMADGSAAKEIATAAEHAGYAAQGKNVEAVHTHLHHVLNCLVGSDDDEFDAQAGNPCKGMGEGAIDDYQGDDQMKEALDQAEDVAELGTKMNSLEPAQHMAKAAQDLLQGVQSK